MIDIVVNGILALAEPHYLASVSVDQLERDLIEEMRLFGLFSESEMGDVERYVQGLVESRGCFTSSPTASPIPSDRANPCPHRMSDNPRICALSHICSPLL